MIAATNALAKARPTPAMRSAATALKPRCALLLLAAAGISGCKSRALEESEPHDAAAFAASSHGGGGGSDGRGNGKGGGHGRGGGKGGGPARDGSGERAEVVREETSDHGEVRLYSGAVADLDGDGALELVAGGFASDEEGRRSTIRVYRQAAAGWTPWLENGWDGGRGSTARNLEIADVDGDGVLDVVVLGRVGRRSHEARARLAIFNLSGGGAGAELRKRYEAEWGEPVGYTHGYGLAIGDLDGDGALEIATGGFRFDGTSERGFVRLWHAGAPRGKATGPAPTIAAAPATSSPPAPPAAPRVLAELFLGDGAASMRVNDLAIGDVDGDGRLEVVVAGRRGALKPEGQKMTLAQRRELGDLSVLRWAGGKLTTRGHATWARATSLRLRSVVLADLDGDRRAEIVVGGQYDADGKAALGLYRFAAGELTLVDDASSVAQGVRGEVKDLVVVGRGAAARILATGVMGGAPERQGTLGAWHLEKDKLVADAALVSQHGDETRSRAVVVVPGGDGSTVLTIGHARQPAAAASGRPSASAPATMVGQVLRWPVDAIAASPTASP